MNKTIMYQYLPGYYKALCDEHFYFDSELKLASSWEIKKGQCFFLEDIVKVGERTRARVRLNNDMRYCTLRNDVWKLIYVTAEINVNE